MTSLAEVRTALLALPRTSDGRVNLSDALAAVAALGEPISVPRQRGAKEEVSHE